MKKIILGILAAVILGGVGFTVKTVILDRPKNPQDFVNQAVANYFETESAAIESSVNLGISEVENLAGNLVLNFSGQGNKLKNYLPDLDYHIAIAGTVGAATLDFAGDLRILDEVFYAKLGKINLTGAPDQITAAIGTAGAFAEKWFSLSFKKLKEADPKIAELFEEQKRQQLATRESWQNFFASNDILVVKKLPLTFSDEQKVEVILNPDVLTSDTFFAEFEKMFAPSHLGGMANPFEMSKHKKEEMKFVIREIVEKSNPQILLRIGKEDGILRSYDFTLDLNLADLEGMNLGNIEVAKSPTGKIKIAASSKISEINQPQQIEIPENAEEIDPLKLIPTPTESEAEVKVEAEGNLE